MRDIRCNYIMKICFNLTCIYYRDCKQRYKPFFKSHCRNNASSHKNGCSSLWDVSLKKIYYRNSLSKTFIFGESPKVSRVFRTKSFISKSEVRIQFFEFPYIWRYSEPEKDHKIFKILGKKESSKIHSQTDLSTEIEKRAVYDDYCNYGLVNKNIIYWSKN